MSSVRIPREKVLEGIRKIVANSHRYVKGSKSLLYCGSIEHAVVSAVWAAEELAKASVLSERLLEHTEENHIEFPKCEHRKRGEWLRCHYCKLEHAKKILGDAFIIESCRWGIARFPFRWGVEDKEASSDVRMSCQFVDWSEENNDWEFGTEYNTHMLELDLLHAIQKNLEIIAQKHAIEELE